jgi:D-alanine-D-alanine ligase
VNIAVIYNLSEQTDIEGRELDRFADIEAIETAGAVKAALERLGHKALTVNVCSEGLSALDRFDAVFNLAENVPGADLTEGEIAQKLDEMAIPFTGASAHSLRQCSDKGLTKLLLSSAGIPTPNFQVFRSDSEIRTELAFPLIVKPLHEDGSIGIADDSIVYDHAQLARRVADILKLYRQPALVEEYIDGREIRAAVLGSEARARVLPLSEIVFSMPEGKPRIVSFAANWLKDSEDFKNTNNRCPADLDVDTAAALRALAAHACSVMGCRDYARVDFRVRGSQPYVLEVNPNPCINPDDAGFIVSAQAIGLSYDNVIGEILDAALARRAVIVPEMQGA